MLIDYLVVGFALVIRLGLMPSEPPGCRQV